MSSRTARTRAALLAAALDLFEERGYDATTAADIAAAAGVSEMTFFRHFATKAALLLDDPYDPLIGDAVAAQPVDRPAVARVSGGLRAGFAAMPEVGGEVDRRRMRIAATTPSLRPAVMASTARTSDVVVEALVRTGTPRGAAEVAAVGVLAGVMQALLTWSVQGRGSLGEALLEALDVMELVR